MEDIDLTLRRMFSGRDQDAGPVGELLQPLVDEDYQPPVATAAGGWSTSATTSLIVNYLVSKEHEASHFIESTLCIEFSMGLISGCPSPKLFKP